MRGDYNSLPVTFSQAVYDPYQFGKPDVRVDILFPVSAENKIIPPIQFKPV